MPAYGTDNGVHPDHHAWWIDPNNGSFIIDGNDGGLNISRDGGKSWRFIGNIPVAQFYHISVDNEFPYNVYGGMQDNGSWRGPSYVWKAQGIRNSYWQEIAFGDGFDVVPDPDDSRYGYAMSQQGYVSRYDWMTGNNYIIRPTHPDPDVKLRFNWNSAIGQDPFKNNVVLFSDGVFTSRNDSEENVIVADLSVVQNLLGLNEHTCSEIYFSDSENTSSLKQEIEDHFLDFKVQSHEEINETLYKMIQSEKLAVTLIMIMIIIISAFNVISSIVMLVIEKENDIKTLKFLGLNNRGFQSVFFKNGLLLNGLGLLIGSIIGTILIILQKNLALIKVGGMNLAYPVEITASNYVIIVVVGLVVAVVSSYFSSLAVKKL